MYAADWEEDCSKGNEGYAASRSIALVKQMSGFRSDHVDEDTRHSFKCSHVCKYCKREFSSGRALGGHMRAHGSLSLEAEAEAAADWHTNHHQVAGGIQEILEQLSSSGGDGDSRSALRDYFLDADNNLHVVSDSTQAVSCTRIKLDFRPGKPCKINKEFGDDPVAARGRKDNDDDYQGEKEYDEDASFKASTTSTTYSNCLEDGDGDNAHETELDNAKFKARGPFYVLRRNRKPSKRLVDRENYAMESMQAFLSASPLKKAIASSSLNNKSHACSECGKEFFSWKALFGHMRCHPEREWRGIQRPISQDSEKQLAADTFLPVASSACKLKKTSSSPQKDSKSDSAFKPVQQTISDDSDAESIEAAYMNGGGKDQYSLQSWTTGKRSKRSRQIVRSLRAVTDNILPEVGSFHASSEIKEDADMANCLVMLACASRNQKEHSRSNNFMTRTMSISSNDLDRRSDERDIIYKKRSMDIDARPYQWPHRKDPSKSNIVKDVYADDGSLCEGMNEEDRRDEETTTKTRRTDLPAGKSKYECSTCKRLFKSHQALGGHRASHKKVKGCFARTHAHPSDDGDIPDSPEEDVTDLDLLRYSHEPERLRASGRKYHHEHQIYGDGEDEKETTNYRSKTHARMKRHECSICHRVFSSGQALGGHKRCHWGGDGSETSAVPASASKQPATSAVQLDLNLPAPEEYEEFYMDCKLSPTAAQANILTTKSISDENIMPQKSPGEFISSLKDSQQKPTDHISHSRERQFLHSPGLKLQNHDSAEEYSELQITNAERNTMNSSRYMQCNICDQIFNSVEALGSHQNTHASVMSTLAGLTPISA